MPHQTLIVNGEYYPSATELTKLLPQDWLWGWYAHSIEKDGWAGWQANKKKSEEGMILGTEVHEYLDKKLQGKIASVSGKAIELGQALWNKVHPTVSCWLKSDTHVRHNKLKIHGSFDALVRKTDETIVIGDYKTSFKKDLSHPIQLAVYEMCWNSENNLKIYSGEIWRIDKETKKVAIDRYDNLKQYEPVVKALRTIWEYTNRGKHE